MAAAQAGGLLQHDMPGGVRWQVPPHYTPPVLIGVGSFGAVGSSVDTRTQEEVAIKKIQNPFFLNRIQALETEHQVALAQNETVRAHHLYVQSLAIQRQAKQLYREVKLLRFMTHPNIIAMRDIYVAPTPDGGEDVYIVMQKMGADLKRIVQVQVLSDPHVQHITYHITKAIAYVQSAGIMHRDLKPENIAMNENMELRVLDFGMARGVNQTTGAGHTGYVVSRHYRAPEVLCFEFDAERLNYTEGVDSWALGCIIAEQITGQVLFHGSNFIEQLAAIAEKLGRPPAAFVGAISNEDVRAFTMSLPEQPSQPLPAYFTANNSVGFGPINPQAIDLVAKLLVYDPGDRLKARDALDHPYFVDIRDEATETRSQVKFDESFEHMNLNVRGWRELFMMELLAVKAGGVGVGGAAAAAAAAAAAGAAAAVAVTAGQPQPQSAVM